MTEGYFSERELGKRLLSNEEIDYKVYNGIMTIVNKYIDNFCGEFSLFCEDDSAVLCGTNVNLLKASIEAEIGIEEPLILIKESDEVNTYLTLDFLEFCYENLRDIEIIRYHSYQHHNDLRLKDTNITKEQFRNKINRLFERNGLIFKIDETGKVIRKLPLEMENILSNINLNTPDFQLNELLKLAIDNIKKPALKDRKIALEKLWDAFERMKTFYSNNKKKSVAELLTIVAEDTPGLFDILDEEFNTLTDIGNNFQIRHFEKDKKEIKSSKHIDYLFYRMISAINLCVLELS